MSEKKESSSSPKPARKPKRASKKASKTSRADAIQAKYPRHSLEKALRIPRLILDQNAGNPCTAEVAATYAGLASPQGPFKLEISSSLKFGLLQRTDNGKISPSELARKILRPQDEKSELDGLREAVLNAPDIAEVYKHYRGENLPDPKFLDNTLEDTFKLPKTKISEFKTIFFETLNKAELIVNHNGKQRIVDFSINGAPPVENEGRLKKLGEDIKINEGDTCFVMMPFAKPHGGYYSSIYAPAIEKAGLTPVRADSDIFGTGKVMDQIWSGINTARILVAELTTKNPNVFYELGLAHALKKPVVLVSANEDDVPFDLNHIRVIYYDKDDPFWGSKLVEKVAENIISALSNPEEAIFTGKTLDQG